MFLQPSRFESTAAFRYLGDRPLAEVGSLLKANKLLDSVVGKLELQNKWGVDRDTAVSIILKNSKFKLDSEVGLVEVKVRHTDKENARDIANEIGTSLETYETSVAGAALSSRIEQAQAFATQVRDEAELQKQALAKLISVRANSLADPVAQLDIDASRNTWEKTLARASEIELQVTQMAAELSNKRKWIELHTGAKIEQSPIENGGDSLDALIIRVLLIGLATALVVPYLLELIYPRRSRAKKTDREVEFENPILPELKTNG